MKPEALESRQSRAEETVFVIIDGEDGYRIHNPEGKGTVYLVGHDLKNPTCTCPDSENHLQDPYWRCKHILAVKRWLQGKSVPPKGAGPAQVAASAPQPAGDRLSLKRSISPDGKIDSLSIELALAGDSTPEELRARAKRGLILQTAIVSDFLQNGSEKENGNGKAHRQEQRHAEPSQSGTEAAIVRSLLGMDTKYGHRLYLAVQVGEDALRFFGSRKQIADALTEAGYGDRATSLQEGQVLNIPCRVVTECSKDGRYLNVVKLLPSGNGNGARRT